MCLTLPGKVAEEREGIALVRFGEQLIEAKNLIGARKGSFVLLKGRIVIEELSKEDERQTAKVLNALKKKKPLK